MFTFPIYPSSMQHVNSLRIRVQKVNLLEILMGMPVSHIAETVPVSPVSGSLAVRVSTLILRVILVVVKRFGTHGSSVAMILSTNSVWWLRFT